MEDKALFQKYPDYFRKIKISGYLEYTEKTREHFTYNYSREQFSDETMFFIGYIIFPTDVAEYSISIEHFGSGNPELKRYLDDILGLSNNEDYPKYRSVYSFLGMEMIPEIPRGKAINTLYVTQVAGSRLGKLRPNKRGHGFANGWRNNNAYRNLRLAKKLFVTREEDDSNVRNK